MTLRALERLKEGNKCCVFLVVLICYYLIMDVITYFKLQGITMTDLNRHGSYSVFQPLSAKLLMTDHTNHYVMVLSTEYFDEWTGFSKKFSFITANMVTIGHFFVALIAAKLVSSEHLHVRRIGVIVFEIKMWLDSLDGVIFRSQSNDMVYKSHKGTLGYVIESTSDILGGIAVHFGVFIYLCKTRLSIQNDKKILPLSKLDKKVTESSENHDNTETSRKCSKRYIFYKCWCFGFQIIVAMASWDKRVEEIGNVLETSLHDPKMTDLQTSMVHSFSTWFVMYLWRLFDGQSVFQIYLVVIFLDKVWEFLNFVQYFGLIVLFAINVLTVRHINHMKTVIGLK